MDWQLLLVGILLVLAVLYLGRRTLRGWRGNGTGCGGCRQHSSTAKMSNAAATETLIPLEQVRLRRR